ncbi:hypothetical protein [Bacillus mycoides]|uniref:hypothetical protein n=1 Tax=Bacillus mycoides TaxID=1405 RepID=UPI003D1C2342
MTTTTKSSELQGKLMEARGIQKGLTSYMAQEFLPQLRWTRTKINGDRDLTASGIAKKVEQHRRQQEVALLAHIDGQHKVYTDIVKEVRREAEDLLIQGVEAPSERDQKLFDIEKNKLKNAALFAPTSQSKIAALGKFAALSDQGQAFAQQIQGEFMEMAQTAITGASNPADVMALTKSLGRINTQLEARAFSEEQHEVAEIVKSATALEKIHFVNTAVLGNALTEVSKDALDFANDRDRYLVVHEERNNQYLFDRNHGYLIN